MTPDARFTQILDDLVMLGVTRSTSFGKRGITADGKVIACFLDDSMAFKLGAGSAEHTKALALSGAELWDPRGKGRAFKDWVRIPQSHEDEWGRYTEIALHRIRQKL
jgi:TfoX/Sxy family transcriptional regulator of competence genes